MKITYPNGATPIDPNELQELIPDYISTTGELNQLEQANIADAFVWTGKQNLDELLTATFTYEHDELASRFHHRLVLIHIFTNGNGRHARLMTDLLLLKLERPKFSWGLLGAHTPLEVEGKTRSEYISALKAADQGDFSALIKFVRG